MSQIVQDPERVTVAAANIHQLAWQLLQQADPLPPLARAALQRIQKLAYAITEEMEA